MIFNKLAKLIVAIVVMNLSMQLAWSATTNVDELNEQALVLYKQGKHEDAIELLKKTLAEVEKAVPRNKKGELKSLVNLANSYKNLRKYSLAKPTFKRLIALDEELNGAKNVDLPNRLDALWHMHFEDGEFLLAEPIAQRSLEITKADPKAARQDLLRRTENLALIYYELGKYSLASPMFMDVLKQKEALLANDHPDIAESVTHLGMLHYKQGSYQKSGQLLDRAFVIRKKLFDIADSSSPGPLKNFPNIDGLIRNFNQRGNVYEAVGQLTRANEVYQSALTIAQDTYASDQLVTIEALNNMARLNVKLGNNQQAKTYAQRALKSSYTVLGSKHPERARSLSVLGLVAMAANDYVEAETNFFNEVATNFSAYGYAHPNLADAYNNMADLQTLQKKYSEAEKTYQRAQAMKESFLGAEHPSVALTLDNIGTLYLRQNQFTLAEPMFTRSLKIFEKSLGPNHPSVAISLRHTASLYEATNRNAESKALNERAEKILAIKK
jgi:tetratricopeptide (TPR) repeat protein